jgi:large subunit ribosomal protein L18
MQAKKLQRRRRIRYSIRKKINGTPEIPRLSVFRSNKQIYAQIIDDTSGHTLVHASSRDIKDVKATKTEIASQVGKALAERAAEKNISAVCFDRGGFLYHGRIKALAEGAREGGLKF